MQAEITREASLRGLTVLNCNPAQPRRIFDTIALISRILGKEPEANKLIAAYQAGLVGISAAAEKFSHAAACLLRRVE